MRLSGRMSSSKKPPPFAVRVLGPTADYEIAYLSDSGRGRLSVSGLTAEPLIWFVDYSEPTAEDGWELGGISHGTKPLWGDVYWFSLFLGTRRRIEYWGDRVLLRTDALID